MILHVLTSCAPPYQESPLCRTVHQATLASAVTGSAAHSLQRWTGGHNGMQSCSSNRPDGQPPPLQVTHPPGMPDQISIPSPSHPHSAPAAVMASQLTCKVDSGVTTPATVTRVKTDRSSLCGVHLSLPPRRPNYGMGREGRGGRRGLS